MSVTEMCLLLTAPVRIGDGGIVRIVQVDVAVRGDDGVANCVIFC